MRARAHALHACDGEERLCGAAAAAPEAASRCAHALRVLCAALRRVVKEMAGARVVAGALQQGSDEEEESVVGADKPKADVRAPREPV